MAARSAQLRNFSTAFAVFGSGNSQSDLTHGTAVSVNEHIHSNIHTDYADMVRLLNKVL